MAAGMQVSTPDYTDDRGSMQTANKRKTSRNPKQEIWATVLIVLTPLAVGLLSGWLPALITWAGIIGATGLERSAVQSLRRQRRAADAHHSAERR